MLTFENQFDPLFALLNNPVSKTKACWVSFLKLKLDHDWSTMSNNGDCVQLFLFWCTGVL